MGYNGESNGKENGKLNGNWDYYGFGLRDVEDGVIGYIGVTLGVILG